jgi:hypothetical protein
MSPLIPVRADLQPKCALLAGGHDLVDDRDRRASHGLQQVGGPTISRLRLPTRELIAVRCVQLCVVTTWAKR